MSVSVTATRSVQYGSLAVSLPETISSGSVQVVSESVANGADTLVNFTADVSQTKLVWISADGDLTLEFNSSSAPDFTIALTDSIPVLWVTGDLASNPLSQDVTALYVTNATGAAVNLTIVYLEDPTP